MKRFAFLYLALMAGTFALAQQPAEWRPNIAEDNKAATWEDTSNFLVNSLASYSGATITANAPSRCHLAVDSKIAVDPLGVAMSVFDEHSLQIASVKPGSFAEGIGLLPGMKLIGISVNGESKVDSQGLRIRTVAGFESVEKALKAGDQIRINVYSDSLSNSTIKPFGPGSRMGKAEGVLAVVPSDGYTIDFARVDPLSIVVRSDRKSVV